MAGGLVTDPPTRLSIEKARLRKITITLHGPQHFRGTVRGTIYPAAQALEGQIGALLLRSGYQLDMKLSGVAVVTDFQDRMLRTVEFTKMRVAEAPLPPQLDPVPANTVTPTHDATDAEVTAGDAELESKADKRERKRSEFAAASAPNTGIPFRSSSGAGQYRGTDGTKTTFADADADADTSGSSNIFCVICETEPDRFVTGSSGWAKRWRMLGIEWLCPTCVTTHPDLREKLATQDAAAAAAVECPAVGQTIAAMLQADAKQVLDDDRRRRETPTPAPRPLAGHCDAIEERYGIIW